MLNNHKIDFCTKIKFIVIPCTKHLLLLVFRSRQREDKAVFCERDDSRRFSPVSDIGSWELTDSPVNERE